MLRVILPALALVFLATLASPSRAAVGETGTYTVRLPDKDWCIAAGDHLTVRDTCISEEYAKLDARDDRTGVQVMIYLQPACLPGDGTVALDVLFREQERNCTRTDVRRSTRGEWAVAEYLIKEYKGKRTNEYVIQACLVAGDTWVDVIVSRVRDTDRDKVSVDAAFANIRMSRNDPPTPRDLLQFGNYFYKMKNSERARVQLEQCLASEKRERQLDEERWRRLIRLLGRTCLASGEPVRAKEVCEYGIANDPDYALFSFILAAAFAQLGDTENTLLYLSRALEQRKPDDKMPDPAEWKSFRALRENKDFQALAARFAEKQRGGTEPPD